MERFVKGDVVVLPFPYTDLSSIKKRPALVIAMLKGNNIILAQITTNQRGDEDLISLAKKDFASFLAWYPKNKCLQQTPLLSVGGTLFF